MKPISDLFDRIVERANVTQALWRAASGKRDRHEVRAFIADDCSERDTIHRELSSSEYRFQPYQEFQVRDTKTRTIHAPCFRDRVVHHAIIAVTGPVFEMGALEHSYACRKSKGQHAAVRQARHWTRRHLWYGKIDVQKFYDSIDHERLRSQLAKRFSERRLLRLFDSLIRSYHTKPGRGLPIGALTSQYLGNFYLDQFDHAMKATRLAQSYLRYMDDIVIWARQDQLCEIRAQAHRELSKLCLKTKNGGEWNRCQRGIPFLGYVIYPDRVRLNRNGRRRLRRKLRVLRRAWVRERIGENQLQQHLTSLFAHVRHADDIAWRRNVANSFCIDEGD